MAETAKGHKLVRVKGYTRRRDESSNARPLNARHVERSKAVGYPPPDTRDPPQVLEIGRLP